MRILLADDQDMVRSALHLVIDQEPNLIVTGEVADPDQLFSKIEEFKPDLLLVDWELLPQDKKTYIKSLLDKFPHLYVIAMSACLISQQEAMTAGANGFLSKIEPVERFISSLRNLPIKKKVDSS